MKYLLVVVFIVAVLWLWSHNRRAEKARDDQPGKGDSQRPAAGTTALTEIVACEVCDVHLPKTDALIGANGKGIYCSDAHRRQADR